LESALDTTFTAKWNASVYPEFGNLYKSCQRQGIHILVMMPQNIMHK